MSDRYPEVLGELATLDLICAGKSIARYGDGEFKICRGGAAKAQQADHNLTRRLKTILQEPGECLIGIPNIHEVLRRHTVDEKVGFWSRFMACSSLLSPSVPYVSAFITRPDSAPWIDVPEYWEKVESIWHGRDVTLVRGSGKSLIADDLTGAKIVTEIMAPRQHAFASYEAIWRQIVAVKPSLVLLCLGPTATPLAFDLCRKGIQAVDMGHAGMFLRKHRRGEPMWLSKEDKAVPA